MRMRLPAQQLIAAVQDRAHESVCEPVFNHMKDAHIKSLNMCLVSNSNNPHSTNSVPASATAIVSCVPEFLSNTQRHGKASLAPNWPTVEKALQWLAAETKNVVKTFVGSCQDISQCTHHALHQSLTRVEAGLKRFDRHALRLLRASELEQVCELLHEEIRLRAHVVQRMSRHLQASWQKLRALSSAILTEVAVQLHDQAFSGIDSMQAALSSHALQHNLIMLANKRVADAVVICLTTMNIKVEQKIVETTENARQSWSRIATDLEMESLVHAILQPGFMRHSDFVPTVTGLVRAQQSFSERVLESITMCMLEPSSVQEWETAQRTFSCTQEMCSAWQQKMHCGVSKLRAQHESQVHNCRSRCDSVLARCTEYGGYNPNALARRFESICYPHLDIVQAKEHRLLQHVCGKLESEQRKWNDIVVSCWHILTSKCAKALQDHKRDCETEFAVALKSLSNVNAQHQEHVENQEVQYQALLDQISCAERGHQMHTLQCQASHRLNVMKELYLLRHHLLLQSLSQQQSRLIKLHEEHTQIIYEVLGVVQESALRDCDSKLVIGGLADDGGFPVRKQLSSPVGMASAASHISLSEALECQKEDTIHSISGARYRSKRDLVAIILSTPKAGYQSDTIDALKGGAGDEAAIIFNSGTSAGETFLGLLDDKEQAMLQEVQVNLPEAALRTHVDSLTQHVVEHVTQHQHQVLASIELWKTQATTSLNARLDALLQQHRPRIGLLEEDWCGRRISRLRGLDNMLAQFLLKQSRAIASQVHNFDNQLDLAKAAAEQNVAQVEGISCAFLECCSAAAVEICARKLQATFATATKATYDVYSRLKADADQDLDSVVAQCGRFLGTTAVLSTDVSMAPHTAGVATGKLAALCSSVADVRCKQQSAVQNETSRAISAIRNARDDLQSRLAMFKRDAAFVEITRKITDETKRDFQNMLDSSAVVSTQTQNCICELQTLIGCLNKSDRSAVEVAYVHDRLLTVAECLRRRFLLRSQALELLKTQSTALQLTSAGVFLSSVYQVSNVYCNHTSSPPGQEDHHEIEANQEQPLRGRVHKLLEDALASLEAAACTYFGTPAESAGSDRSDIPANHQLFISEQNLMLQALSAKCTQYIAHEQQVFRTQVLTGFKALHGLPEAICNAHVFCGVHRVREQINETQRVQQDQMMPLRRRRQMHQQQLPSLLTIDCSAQLEDLVQACTDGLFQHMLQMCSYVADLISCWVTPTDLHAHAGTLPDVSAEAMLFRNLALLESAVDHSIVHPAGVQPERNMGILKWHVSIPAITADTLDGTQAPMALADSVGFHGFGTKSSLEITALNLPITWLLMRAYVHGTKKLMEEVGSCCASAMSSVDSMVRQERMWQDTWAQTLQDVYTTKKFA